MGDAAVRTVSEIVGEVRSSLAERFGRVRVRGEISNFKRAASGHLYFVLKDASAQLRAVCFRGAAIGLRFLPADGLEVEAEGELTVYEPRGDLQLLVRRLAPSGQGALMQAFERLKAALAAEGLFDPARKRPLPRFPRTVAIITSPTGAAVRDLLHVLERRWPLAEAVLLPVRVQGEGSAAEIADALDRVSRWGGADVVIAGRGGGSLEDLWAFNEEVVARAIAACRTPVISAVGHETDVTIADFVADARAATPTAAAALAVPDRREISALFAMLGGRATRVVERRLHLARERVERIAQAYGLRRPEDFLRREMQRVDRLAFALEQGMERRLRVERGRVERLDRGLARHHPVTRLAVARRDVDQLASRLRRGTAGRVEDGRRSLAGVERALGALDPTRVLVRGYCVARRGADGPVVTAAAGLEEGASLTVQFHRDRAETRVVAARPGRLAELEEGGAAS